MKYKYLSLALAAAMATTGLTACGGDDDSNYTAPTENTSDDTGGDTGGATGGETGGDTGGDTTADTAEDTTADTAEDTTADTAEDTSGSTDSEDNVGDAADSFDIAAKSSVVGQQYIRGSSSNFDKTAATNGNASDNGNSTVLGAENLQNRSMTNIVVAQYPDTSVTDAQGVANDVKYILGEIPKSSPDVTDVLSIQYNNDSVLVDNTGPLSPFVHVTKNLSDEYDSYGQESIVSSKNSKFTQHGMVFTATTDTDNDVRVYGKLSSTEAEPNNSANSARYLVNDSAAINYYGDKEQFKVTGLQLDNVQYGRVTGALDGLTADDIAGESYIRAEFANKNFVGNTTQTDVYFYRGLGQTAISDMPTSGTFQYAGHALMYGIDNSYTGENANGLSNSVAFGSEAEALGNFVKATYNASNQTVAGSVFNVWDLDTSKTTDAFKSVDLVKFDGEVTGNTIKGDALRTYAPGTAAFKGSFYGSQGQEMGGSFNSIRSGYEKSEWGGVFGAEKIVQSTAPEFVPPINAVE